MDRCTYEHRMAGVAQQHDASRAVDPLFEGLSVHEAPLERRLDVREQLADPVSARSVEPQSEPAER